MKDSAVPIDDSTLPPVAAASAVMVPPGTQTLDAVGLAEVVEIHDRDEWNGLVLERPYYEIEQGWEWDEIRRDSGWTPHRYAAVAGGRRVALASVASRRLPGLPYSVLDASHGPLVAPEEAGAWRALLGAIRELAERDRAVFLRVSPGVAADDSAPREALARHGFRALPDEWTTWNPPRIVVALRLDADEESLRRRCRKSVRYDLTAARRRGVVVREAKSRADLVAFHRILVAMGRQKGYPVRRFSRLEALWAAYVVAGQGVLLLAEHEGDLVGGLLGTRFGERAYLQSAGVMRTGERLCHGPLLYWEFIRWALSAGCAHIDWGGSGTAFPPEPADPGYSLYWFKAGFGSELRYCAPYHDLVFRPQLYRLARALEGWALPRAWRLRAYLNH